MTKQEDMIMAEWEGQHYPGLIKAQRQDAARQIAELGRLIQRIKGKNGDVEDLLDQIETVVEQGRAHDPYRNLK